MTDDESDESLVRRAQAGDASALALLVRRHLPKIMFRLRVDGRIPVDQREDVAQEVVLSMIDGLQSYDSEKGRFRTWLGAIVRNQINAWFRQHYKHATEELPQDSVVGPEQPRAGNELEELLEQFIERLTPEERELLIARVVDGEPYEDIAARMGEPPATIRKRFERILKKLRDWFGGAS